MSHRKLRAPMEPKVPKSRVLKIGADAARSLGELHATAVSAQRDLQVAFAMLCKSQGITNASLVRIDLDSITVTET